MVKRYCIRDIFAVYAIDIQALIKLCYVLFTLLWFSC